MCTESRVGSSPTMVFEIYIIKWYHNCNCGTKIQGLFADNFCGTDLVVCFLKKKQGAI